MGANNGGGILVSDYCNMTIHNCIFSILSSINGGIMHNFATLRSSLEVTNTSFINCTSSNYAAINTVATNNEFIYWWIRNSSFI